VTAQHKSQPPARRVLDLAMSEAQWAATVIGTDKLRGLARTLGWTCLHVSDSRKEVIGPGTGERKLVGDSDAAGLPDWLLLRDRQVWLELKKERGKLSVQQQNILWRIHKAGGEAYVLRPCDYSTALALLGVQHQDAATLLALSRDNLTREGVLP
jgi:hypothetical protein